MAKCGDCKWWDRENQKIARIGFKPLEEYGVAYCINPKHILGSVLLAWCVDYPCASFEPIKPKQTREDLHKRLDDILDGRD